MPETTAGSTTPEIERPSFNDIYEDLTGFDDEAVTKHLGYDLESLFEGINDGSLSAADRLNVIRACEFLRLRKEYADQGIPNPDALAEQVVREMPRREIKPIEVAYWNAALAELAEDDVPDPESTEGKDSPSAEPSNEPSATDAPESTPPESEISG